MAKYSEEFKYSIMTKMMPPQNQSVSAISRETGLSEATLHKWRREARAKGIAVPSGELNAERWSTQDISYCYGDSSTQRSGNGGILSKQRPLC